MALIKTAAEIENIRASGRILSEVRSILISKVAVGVKLSELDSVAKKEIENRGGVPAFLGYKATSAERPYPKSICASVNDVIVHGIPGAYRLRSGDVLKIDLGVKYKEYNSDSAVTVGVGEVSKQAVKLMETTELALNEAIQMAFSGKTLGDIGYAIQKRAKLGKFWVVKGLTGHGIGLGLHEPPTVLNEGKKGVGMKLQPGMALAIEPMLAAGTPHLVLNEDGSYATEDGSITAHFEHTIIITDEEPEVVTR